MIARVMSTDVEIEATFEVMKELRTHLTREAYVPHVRRLMGEQGFILAAVLDGDQPQAVAGYRFRESLAWGHHLYVDDLVTLSGARSAGYGGYLFKWLVDQAKQHGCQALHLDSGVQRHDAHRFYLRERMMISCFHFQIAL